jgi:hypothetical protein
VTQYPKVDLDEKEMDAFVAELLLFPTKRLFKDFHGKVQIGWQLGMDDFLTALQSDPRWHRVQQLGN